MFFQPGTFTNIKMAYALRTCLGSPYGNCNSHGSGQHLYHNKTWAGQQVVYDEQSCTCVCFQKGLLKACGCIDTFSAILMDETEDLGYPYCSNIGVGAKAFQASFMCLQ